MTQIVGSSFRQGQMKNPCVFLPVFHAGPSEGFGNVVRACQVPEEFGIDRPCHHGAPQFIPRRLNPRRPQLVDTLSGVLTQQHPTLVGTLVKKHLDRLAGRHALEMDANQRERWDAHQVVPASP